MAVSAHIKKQTGTFQINNIVMHQWLKKTRNQTKFSRRKQMIKFRGEKNEIKTKKIVQRINNNKKNCFFEKINKLKKILAKLTSIPSPTSPKRLDSTK